MSLGCLFLSLAGSALRAETVTLVPVADTTLFESAPDDNMGGWEHVAAGTTGNQGDRTRNRGLFRFELAGKIPPFARVTNAVLTLKVVRLPGSAGGGGPVNSTFELRRVLVPWGEGDKLGDRGAPADAGEATWNYRLAPSQAWSVPGGAAPGDFAETPSATKVVAGKGAYAFGPTAELIADVQAWLDLPSANFGWVLLSQSEAATKTARGFGAREDLANAPTLAIGYTSSAPLRIEGVALLTNRFQFHFAAQARQSYTVEFKPDLSATGWTTLTYLAAPATNGNIAVSDPLALPRRFYRLRTP